MALRFCESFDHCNVDQLTRKWTMAGGGRTIGTAYGRNGTNGLATNSNGFVRKTIDDQQTWIIGCAYYSVLGEQDKEIIIVMDANYKQIYLRNPANTSILHVIRGDGIILATVLNVFVHNTWNFIELKVKIDDSTGFVIVKKNEIEIVNISNVDTKNTANASANTISFSGMSNVCFDDIYICDTSGSFNNNFLGDIRVCSLLPNGAGASIQWTPSAGANYECVDESPANDDTDYVSSATANQIDTYAYADLPAFTGDVKGVQVLICARKDDAGARQIAVVARPGITNHAGAAKDVSDSYLYHRQIWENNPDTTNPWTINEVNAAEFGVKLVS